MVAQQTGSRIMKNLKVRIAALTLGGMVAGSTVLGALAYQGESNSPGSDPAADAVAFPVFDAEPIVYTGSYGLFPAK
jgi:hypothetical protein